MNIITYNNKQYQLITDENQILTTNDIRYCDDCNSYHMAIVGKTPKWYKQHGNESRFYAPYTKKYTIEDYC
jgi:hypothetical protein